MLDSVVTESPPQANPVQAADDLLTLNVKSLNLSSKLAEDEELVGGEDVLASIISVVALTWAT
jgi:hypothetical protein